MEVDGLWREGKLELFETRRGDENPGYRCDPLLRVAVHVVQAKLFKAGQVPQVPHDTLKVDPIRWLTTGCYSTATTSLGIDHIDVIDRKLDFDRREMATGADESSNNGGFQWFPEPVESPQRG